MAGARDEKAGTDARRSGALDETQAIARVPWTDRRGEANPRITNTKGYKGQHRDRG